MADKPGAKKPEAKKADDFDLMAWAVGVLFGLAVLGAVFAWLSSRINVSGGDSVGDVIYNLFVGSGLLDAVYRFLYGPFFWISMLVSAAAAAAAVYSFFQYKGIRDKQREAIRLLEAKLVQDGSVAKNERWERIMSLVSSENPGDWRVAIIEADIGLEELVRSMGYHGDTLGDMLKAVEKSDFETIDLAWEAHKIRNRIAHSGSDFILTHREAKRIIDLFRQVFQEFDVI